MKMKKQLLIFGLLALFSLKSYSQDSVRMVFPILPYTEEETKCLEKHTEAVLKLSSFNGMNAFAELCYRYLVPSVQSEYLRDLFLERERRKYLYNIMVQDAYYRVQKQLFIDSLYQDSIDIRLIPYNKQIAGELISLSLYLPTMKLTTIQKNKLLDTGLKIAKKLRHNPRYNYDVEVMDSLKHQLSSNQLRTLLSARNMDAALEKARVAWNKIEKAGLIQGLDSTKEISLAQYYYIEEFTINDMYVGNEEYRMRNMRDLWAKQPKLVLMYESLRQKESLIKKKEEKEKNLNLIW